MRASLSTLLDQLDPERFMRIHRSAIVRLDAVRELRFGGAGESRVLLRDATELPVSRRRLAGLKERLTPDR